MSDTEVHIDRHWCLTEAKDRVVPETDPEARFLHWVPGDVVPLDEAKRLGAVRAEETVELPAAAPKRKPGRPPGSKNRTPSENKARRGFGSANI